MGTQAREALKTYLRAALTAVLTAVLTVFTTAGHFPNDRTEWLALLWAVVVAILPVVIRWLDPTDCRYGRCASTPADGTDSAAAAPATAPTAPRTA